MNPNTAMMSNIGVKAGNGIFVDQNFESSVEVSLAENSGLEFDSGDLKVNTGTYLTVNDEGLSVDATSLVMGVAGNGLSYEESSFMGPFVLTVDTNVVAEKEHTHAISDVTDLQTSLGAKKNEATYEISTNTNLTAGGRYMVDTGTALTLTLPDTPAVGDEIQIFDKTNTAETNNITVNNNGLKINGVVDTLIIDVNGAVAGLVYTGTSLGWRI
jgi:hypothetical protein